MADKKREQKQLAPRPEECVFQFRLSDKGGVLSDRQLLYKLREIVAPTGKTIMRDGDLGPVRKCGHLDVQYAVVVMKPSIANQFQTCLSPDVDGNVSSEYFETFTYADLEGMSKLTGASAFAEPKKRDEHKLFIAHPRELREKDALQLVRSDLLPFQPLLVKSGDCSAGLHDGRVFVTFEATVSTFVVAVIRLMLSGVKWRNVPHTSDRPIRIAQYAYLSE